MWPDDKWTWKGKTGTFSPSFFSPRSKMRSCLLALKPHAVGSIIRPFMFRHQRNGDPFTLNKGGNTGNTLIHNFIVRK